MGERGSQMVRHNCKQTNNYIWLNIQMEIGDKWCPSGVCIGTSTV